MPHKVHSFFNPQSILPAYFQEPKKSLQRSSDDRPRLGDRTVSVYSTSSQESNERTSRMPDIGKRLSFHGLHTSRLRSSSHHDSHVSPKLSIKMESPPLVYYGQPTSSTGALLSGQLKVYITDESMEIADYRMKFVLETEKKKPFHANCTDCSKQSQELTSWNFLQGPTKLRKGEHSFPFSYLLKGDLPVSMDGTLSKVRYVLHASITSKDGEKITHSETLPVKRALFASELPKQSMRIFPPTNLTAHIDLPSVIHPIGEFTATMRLDGIIEREDVSKIQRQWRLKRITWRLEETQKVVSPACGKHAAKVLARSGEDPKLSHQHTDVRTIGSDDVRSGWKSDYDSPAGSIEMEFPFSIKNHASPTCDIKDEERGTVVSHQLIVELIVTEEQSPINKPQQSIPTGAARILRMQFNVIVTERLGLGISWDEEQPPTYEDVPSSPPGYYIADIRDYTGSPLDGSSLPPIPDYEQLEQLPQ